LFAQRYKIIKYRAKNDLFLIKYNAKIAFFSRKYRAKRGNMGRMLTENEAEGGNVSTFCYSE
jgi:hypothetical protein